MKELGVTLLTEQELKLKIELIINRNLYSNKQISKDTYLKTEVNILKDIESEKRRNNKI